MVVTWLNKAKEAEEKRARTAAEPLALDPLDGEGNSESSEEDDDDQDEFVYDIQVHESLLSQRKERGSVPGTLEYRRSSLILHLSSSISLSRLSGLPTKKIPACASQSVEELAMGDEGWCYQPPATASNGEDGNKTKANVAHEGKEDEGVGAPTDVAEIRSIIVRLARREDR